MVFLHVPGVTADHLAVWLPSMNALLCGDTIYPSFPRLRPHYSSALLWVSSLDRLRMLRPHHLLLSRAIPLEGVEVAYEALTSYRDALQLVHDQTLRLTNLGYDWREMRKRVELPENLRAHPFLQQLSGTVAEAVSTIYEG